MTRDILRTGRLEMLLAAAGSIRSMPLVTYLSFGRALRAADLHGEPLPCISHTSYVS